MIEITVQYKPEIGIIEGRVIEIGRVLVQACVKDAKVDYSKMSEGYVLITSQEGCLGHEHVATIWRLPYVEKIKNTCQNK